jgi:hypothetical protein
MTANSEVIPKSGYVRIAHNTTATLNEPCRVVTDMLLCLHAGSI